MPFRHARHTRAVWQYRHVMALSGPLATHPGTSRDRLPSASQSCCDRTTVQVSHLHSINKRLTAHRRYDAGLRAAQASHYRHGMDLFDITRPEHLDDDGWEAIESARTRLRLARELKDFQEVVGKAKRVR